MNLEWSSVALHSYDSSSKFSEWFY